MNHHSVRCGAKGTSRMAIDKTDKAAQSRSRMVRRVVLGVVLVAITGIATAHQYYNGAGKPPGVDALCPFGGLETLFTFLSGTGFVEKTAASALVLLGGTLGIALVFRRSFCGQLCPLGALQGAFGWIGRKLKVRREMPKVLDRPARYLKYGVLVFFTIWTWQAAALVMRPYDPWATWAHLTSAELWTEFAVGVVVLGISLAGSVVYERFFCKFLCPTGALLGALSKVSFFRIKRDADACIDCGACDKACPMNIAVSTADEVKSTECISCNECVNSCPAAGALEVKAGREGRSVSPLVMTGVVVGIIAVAIALSTAAGVFAWKMPSLGEAIEQHGGTLPDKSSAGFDTSLIKGYMTMAEIADATGIPAAEFTAKFGVPAEALGEPMKEIKDTYEFSPDDVRVWVEERLAAQ